MTDSEQYTKEELSEHIKNTVNSALEVRVELDSIKDEINNEVEGNCDIDKILMLGAKGKELDKKLKDIIQGIWQMNKTKYLEANMIEVFRRIIRGDSYEHIAKMMNAKAKKDGVILDSQLSKATVTAFANKYNDRPFLFPSAKRLISSLWTEEGLKGIAA